ncbi:hypothetical protein BDZ45DRAFT_191457 [Acephala macrosclerotiorum]|nr:hypothetical protein BDZ45DRAFT_191457 [Acephala macrosclerotiorum]
MRDIHHSWLQDRCSDSKACSSPSASTVRLGEAEHDKRAWKGGEPARNQRGMAHGAVPLAGFHSSIVIHQMYVVRDALPFQSSHRQTFQGRVPRYHYACLGLFKATAQGSHVLLIFLRLPSHHSRSASGSLHLQLLR